MSKANILQGKGRVLVSNAQNKSIRTKKRGNTIRKTLLSLLLLVFLIGLTLSLGVITGLIGIHFPQLTGSYAVGKINYDLLDPSHQEPFLNNPHAQRKIMVTIYYPADPPANVRPAPYTEGKMADLLASKAHLPAVAVHLIHAHAYEQVPIAAGRFPVVLFSPGIGTPPVEYSSTVEDVASHGYIVAMIYHTYSVPATVFANGRVALINDAGIRSENEPAGTSDAHTNKDRNAIGAVWVADARFTLDQLTKLNSDDRLLKGHLNLAEVGMYGHSFGGATAAEVCREDSRFKACLNMDGTAFTMTNSSQIKQPGFREKGTCSCVPTCEACIRNGTQFWYVMGFPGSRSDEPLHAAREGGHNEYAGVWCWRLREPVRSTAPSSRPARLTTCSRPTLPRHPRARHRLRGCPERADHDDARPGGRTA